MNISGRYLVSTVIRFWTNYNKIINIDLGEIIYLVVNISGVMKNYWEFPVNIFIDVCRKTYKESILLSIVFNFQILDIIKFG